jgi:putative heme iron utilization protein
MLLAASRKMAARLELVDEARDKVVKDILRKHNFASSKAVTQDRFDAVLKEISEYGEPPDFP